MSLAELRKTLRQTRASAVRRQALTRKLGLRVEELEKVAEQATEAGRQLRQVETDAGMTEALLRETVREIEDAEHRVLKAVLRAPVAVNEILDLGVQMRKAKIRVTEVTRDADDQDPDFNEEWHTDRVCKALDNIGRLFRKHQKLLEPVAKKGDKRMEQKIAASADELFQALLEIRLSKERVGPILDQLKAYVHQMDASKRISMDCERRAGMGLAELKKTLRQVRESPVRRQALTRKLGLRVEELEIIAQQALEASKQIKTIEVQAGMSEVLVRETVKEIEDGERAGERAKAEM
ncbi:MAG: hypothetical protein ABUL67_03235, partial [Haliangium ochraceum]